MKLKDCKELRRGGVSHYLTYLRLSLAGSSLSSTLTNGTLGTFQLRWEGRLNTCLTVLWLVLSWVVFFCLGIIVERQAPSSLVLTSPLFLPTFTLRLPRYFTSHSAFTFVFIIFFFFIHSPLQSFFVSFPTYNHFLRFVIL